ncbi:hypothetical protein [Austwickia chelonae]|uniref:hypothetical protein n=1 Tax=Austwickia chelonae TaxID=100225 RepID=UPI000E248618|nr:hypothetical protein [Austwickia chelonae]
MSGKARRRQLATLLRIRRLEEDLAKGELAAANARIRAAHERLSTAQESYQREVTPPESCDVNRFRAHLAHSTSAAAMVRGAERGITAAESEADEVRDKVRLARIKSQGLERLVDRVDAAAFAESLAADQRTAEESRAGIYTKGRHGR